VVSGSYFPTLGVQADVGRLIGPEDDRTAGGSPVAVISYTYWSKRFNRDSSVVGRRINLNGSSFTIIGVTPSEFFGVQPGESVDVFVPMTMIAAVEPEFALAGTPYSTLTAPFRNWIHLMARLEPGITQDQAQASLEPIYAQAKRDAAAALGSGPFDLSFRKMFLERRLRLEPGSQGLTALREQFSKPLLVLMAIVGVLLFIACSNVANLLLAHAKARQKEVALRLALGAGPRRLMRQLLTESVLLAMAGGALGMIFAFWGSDALLSFMSRSPSPVLLRVAPDARVLTFTLLVSLVAAIFFGLVPSWSASRLELSQSLNETSWRLGSGRQHSRLARTLAVAQIGLSVVLLVGAGLLVRTLRKLQEVNPGFNRENVLLFSLDPGMLGYKDSQVAQLYERLLDRMKSLPGVRAASLSLYRPLSQRFSMTAPTIEGNTVRPGENVFVSLNLVGPGYFRTLGTGILMGREFTDADRAGAPKVAVVNQAMARYCFGNGNPLGRRFSIPGWAGDNSMLEIVGVVENMKNYKLREPAPPAAYVPFSQSPNTFATTFEVRTASDPESLINSARRVVEEADSRLPVFDVKTLDEQLDETLVQERLVASLSTLFGLLALSLTCVGLYGLIAYSVGRRTHEFGVRMALGAERGDVLRLVLAEGIRLALAGVALGVAAALVVTRFASSLLFGVKPTDPLTFAVAPLVLTAVALLACFIPARRATKVDPMVALRHE
jgi:predicted permease